MEGFITIREENMTKQFLNLFGILALGLCCRTAAIAAEGNTLARLDEALKAANGFQYGQDAAPLKLVESIVTETAQDSSQCRLVEKRLLESLRTSPSRDTREFICRQLFTIGSEQSIPQLEQLLVNPALGHMARFALARNEAPEASAALARALEQTSGPLQAGIINSLGQRGYAPALPAIIQLLSSTDPLIAEVAAAALGDIGGTEAVKVLESARAKAPPGLKINIDAALLACADRFVAAGNKDAARTIYEEFSAPGQPKNLRSAGLRGLVQTDPDKALPLLIAAIKGSDADLCEAAIGLTRSASGPETTEALARLLPALPPQTQELLLNALGSRGDNAAAPAVLAAMDSQNEGVRLAACAAIGFLGDNSSVDPLVRLAANTSGALQQVARASLAQLSRGDVNGALVQHLGGTGTKVRIEAISALAARRASSAANDLLKVALDPDPAVRREVIRALGAVVDDQSLARLVALATELKTVEDLAALEESVAAAFQRIPSREKQAEPLLVTFAVAPANAQPVLLHLLGLTATRQALEVTRAAVKDENAPVREAAIRSLAEWPDAAPADDLLGLVRTADRPSYKVLALRGYVRMAGLGKNSGAMYARAMEVAERPEDKKLVLGCLGSADGAQAVDLVEPYLKNEQLRVEAAQALVQIVDRLRQTDVTRSRAALKAILAVPVDSRIHQQAQEVLNQMAPYEAHILDWVGAGPYSKKDKGAQELFDIVFPPEKAEADVKWVHLTKGIGTWEINLAEALGGGDNVVGYVRTRIWSPSEQEARLEMGSDDGIKVWLNGVVVHANNAGRGITVRQDTAKVNLKEGWNELLLKVTNAGGGWACSCRVRRPDGSELDGLKFEAK